jgi:dUTP pyrophosphatase
MKIKFIRFNEKASIPERAHYTDTGADCRMLTKGSVFPGETRVIKTGFGIYVPNGYSARFQVRTSVAQQGIVVQSCAIDAHYEGELHYIITNCSDEPFFWKEGDKLCYIEVYPTVYPDFVEDFGKERGDDAFGSTGK